MLSHLFSAEFAASGRLVLARDSMPTFLKYKQFIWAQNRQEQILLRGVGAANGFLK
jgi:hypothetical protein